MKKWLKLILIFVGLLIFIAALHLLNSQIKSINLKEIQIALSNISNINIAIAMLCALLYYTLLGGYDIVAFHHINNKAPLKPREIFFSCFISNAIGNNTCYSMLFGGSLRYRLYSMYQVSMLDITKVIFFSSATIWLGLFATGGLSFVIDPVSLSDATGHNITTRSVGIVFLAILITYIILCSLNLKSVKILKWNISFPSIKTAAIQILLATADWIMASLTLYILMPPDIVSYFVLFKVFLVAQLLGIISQVPGGIGVFETSIAILLPNIISNPAVIGGLLAYRAIFYFLPLSIALLTLSVYEIARLVKRIDDRTKMLGKAISQIIVQILSISTFFSAMLAIFTISTPFSVIQLKKIASLMPLRLLDLSHFLLSIIAVGLLFTARAIQLRIKNARRVALTFIALALVFFVIMGINLITMAYFICLFVALLAAKKYFYRDRSMLSIPFNTWWFCATSGIFAIALWVGFISNKQDILLWINPSVFINALMGDEESARFLRTVIGIIFLFVVVLIEQLFRKTFNKPVAFSKEDIANIVKNTNYTYALNVWGKDKKIMTNSTKDTFLMYAEASNNRIVLGDPIGVSANKSELIWQFKEYSDRDNMRISFIGIGHKYMNIYRDVGLDIIDIASEARIVLKNYDKDKNNLNSKVLELENKGYKYEILKADQLVNFEGIFNEINKQWEKEANYINRNFIPGDYNEASSKGFDFGVLKNNKNEIVGFSIIYSVENKHETYSPIVRYIDCSVAVFDYMICKNVLWAKENGYKFFNLGFTYIKEPFKNDFAHYFAKTFAFAEHFNYDFSELKKFKESFNPIWNEKYVAIHLDEHILTFIKNFTSLITPRKEKIKSLRFFKRFFKR
jgi:phosphatidylglycerol lysyltransferase